MADRRGLCKAWQPRKEKFCGLSRKHQMDSLVSKKYKGLKRSARCFHIVIALFMMKEQAFTQTYLCEAESNRGKPSWAVSFSVNFSKLI